MKTNRNYHTPIKARIRAFFEAEPSTLFSAGDLYARLRDEGWGTNLTTVYRNLDAMSRDGLLLRFSDEATGTTVFQYAGENGDCRSHLHIKCVSCGEVIHLNCAFMDELARHASEEHGFRLLCDGSILYGVCAACGKKTRERENEVPAEAENENINESEKQKR